MSVINYNPFPKQEEFHFLPFRHRGAFAGKRGGKTESGAVEKIRMQEEKRVWGSDEPWKFNGIDPYVGTIIAPTSQMLDDLCIPKFMAYAKGFYTNYNASKKVFDWHDGSLVKCYSADKPQRIEGGKWSDVWIDEVFQCKEQIFLEAIARVADTKGRIILTGSLGVQYANPKRHWVYKYFKDPSTKMDIVGSVEWATMENSYFPESEIESLKSTLDPITFRQMFELSWDTAGKGRVYEIDETHHKEHKYNPSLRTCVSIDWGWNHPMACLFFQYDAVNETVYLFDEIFGSGITLDSLYQRIKDKGYRVDNWVCDTAGNQTKELSGISNIEWFAARDIDFDYRSTAISYGIPTVRSFLKNSNGQTRFFIDQYKCKNTWDQMVNYQYQEINGMITDTPAKVDDDGPDAVRYYFVNMHDIFETREEFKNIGRFRR